MIRKFFFILNLCGLIAVAPGRIIAQNHKDSVYLCGDVSREYTACDNPYYFVDLWCYFQLPDGYSGDIAQINVGGASNYTLTWWGPFSSPQVINSVATLTACSSVTVLSSFHLTSSNINCSLTGGYYYLKISPSTCHSIVNVLFQVSPNPCLPCVDCLPSFSPQPDSTYIISAWVKQSDFSPSTTTYTDANIMVDFGPTSNPTTYYGSGQIIDGWQRIEGAFLVPSDAQEFKLILGCGITAWFDDIRIYPKNGSMKTYVFDPLTLRLAAELDERNYATIYEYDEEGHLTRVKKETERGIMTIQENKTATAK